VGLFTGDYTKEEPSNAVENLKVKDTLAVSLKGIVMGDKIGNFTVVNAEPAR
jgi:hypothetical protein